MVLKVTNAGIKTSLHDFQDLTMKKLMNFMTFIIFMLPSFFSFFFFWPLSTVCDIFHRIHIFEDTLWNSPVYMKNPLHPVVEDTLIWFSF